MKFSIIVPVYNTEKYLKQCIESVIAQSYQDWELLLVDDGSLDRSPSICDEYAAIETRIKVIHKSNGGLSDARNFGLDIATGEYILFLDSDDWWDNRDALFTINNKILKSDPDLLIFGLKKYLTSSEVFYDEVKLSDNDAVSPEECIHTGLYRASACDKVIKRNIIERNGLRFVKGQLSEDIEWCAKLIQLVNTISLIDISFYVYRQNQASISHNVKRKNIADILGVIEQYADAKGDVSTVLQNFLALQYLLLIATSTRVNNSEISDLLKKMRNYWYLLDYNEHPYVRFVSKFKFIGFKLFYQLVRVYMSYRE